jgi:hypothetical protein
MGIVLQQVKNHAHSFVGMIIIAVHDLSNGWGICTAPQPGRIDFNGAGVRPVSKHA